jgi:hypothetical protein
MFGNRDFRTTFRWQKTNWTIGISWGVGVAMLFGIPTAESVHLPIRLIVWGSYLSFSVALVFSTLAWLASKSVYDSDPRYWTNPRRKRATKKNYLWAGFKKWGVAAVIAGFAGFFLWETHQIDYMVALQRLNGLLIPANEPSPTDACQVAGSEHVAIYMGNAIAFSAEDFPVTLISAEHEDQSVEPVLILGRNSDGSISLSGTLFDKDGKLIATMQNNRFEVNQNTSWKFVRHSFSDLRVIDNYGVTVLKIKFYNKNALSLTGYFRGRGGSTLEVYGKPGRFCMANAKGWNGAGILKIGWSKNPKNLPAIFGTPEPDVDE